VLVNDSDLLLAAVRSDVSGTRQCELAGGVSSQIRFHSLLAFGGSIGETATVCPG